MPRLLLVHAATPPAASKEHGGGMYGTGDDAGFDKNMLVILAALLFALICVLGLNSIIRACRRRLVSDKPAAAGLGKRALSGIPVAVYGHGVELLATDCQICLEEFGDGEKVRVLPRCNHGFHIKCIDMWLAGHLSCPTCRRSLSGRGAEAGGAVRGAGVFDEER